MDFERRKDVWLDLKYQSLPSCHALGFSERLVTDWDL